MKGLSSLYRGLSGVEPTADDIGAVKKVGDTMTGALILSGSPTEPNQAATKSYVDSNSSSWGSIGGTLSNQTDLQNALNAKQDTLVSGTNIKTINSSSILGSGNLSITASAAGLNTQVQFNDSGTIGGDAGLTYDKTTDNLTVGSISLNQSGLVVKGATSNALTIKPNETLSASRTLNLKINDVDRTIDLSGNLTVPSAATISGTNTGDQTNITGNAGTATTLQTSRSIYGNNFDGSAALSQIIASTFGGTGNGFTKFTGATSLEKTYTLPDANSTILTDNTAITVPQGGTGLATLTTAYGVVCAGTTANGSLQNAGAGTNGQYLKSNGASSLPSFASLDPATTTTQGVAYLLPNRNILINGAMAIDQRNLGASQTITAGAVLAYTVDRWYAYCTGANATGQRVAGTAPNQFNYRFTGAASVSKIGFAQRIEATNCQHLAGKTATLSVDLANSLLTTVTWKASYATTADAFGTIASPTKTQIATGTFTVNSTLTRYATSIAIPALATTGIEIEFSVGAQTSGTWTIGRAQLEDTPEQTAFEYRPNQEELFLCQRYYEFGYTYAVSYNSNAVAVQRCIYPYKVNKRVSAPSGSVSVVSGSLTSPSIIAISEYNAWIGYASGSGGLEGTFAVAISSEL